MLKTISNLPNRFNPFTPKDFAIYVLDDYAVHLMPEIRKACYQRGYILVVMGGGITGFIQANDTDLHHHLKSCYRNEEMTLMLKKLENDKSKIPSPSREQMIGMLLTAWKEIDVDYPAVFKKLFVTSKFDGSEDFLVSDKLFSLIGDDMFEYCRQLLRTAVPTSLQAVMKQIIPPKGICRKNTEGSELLEFAHEEDTNELENDENDVSSSEDEDEAEAEENVAPSSAILPPVVNEKSSGIASLQNVSTDPEINKDASFLDAIQKVFEENDTSI